MDAIDIAINKFMQYMSELGLEKWQLLIIAIALIVLLILIARHRRKVKVRTIRPIQIINQPEIIGRKLYNRGESHPKMEDVNQQPTPAPEKPVNEGRQTWRQTTIGWRKATEQIRQLRREVTKHKRTEEQLRQKIAELTASAQQNRGEIEEIEHAEHRITPESTVPKVVDTQIQEVSRSEHTDDNIKQSPVHNITTNQEHREDFPGDEQTQNTKGQPIADLITSSEQTRQEMTNNCIQDVEPAGKEIINKNNSKCNGVPLDVRELQSIAALAKRLRRSNHQQQNK